MLEQVSQWLERSDSYIQRQEEHVFDVCKGSGWWPEPGSRRHVLDISRRGQEARAETVVVRGQVGQRDVGSWVPSVAAG